MLVLFGDQLVGGNAFGCGFRLETTSWAETPSGVALCQFRVICVEDEPLELESLILAQNERWRQA